MTTSRTILTSSLIVLVLAGVPGMSVAEDETVQRGVTTAEEAAALVLASDPRFADAADWESLRKESLVTFEPRVFEEDYYRLLSPASSSGTTFMELFRIAPRETSSWLYEVTLVRDCGEYVRPSGDALTVDDPCGWRHSWFYRVEPDGSATLLFDEGDPDV